MQIPSRRHFLTLGARSLAAIGASSLAGRLSQVNALAATSCPAGADYKALVCVFLFGGNDGNNMVIPISTPASNPNNSYATYASARGGLALPQTTLNIIPTSKGDQYGLHPSLAELAALYNNKKLSVLTNVGSLVTPLTKADYLQKSKEIPLNLFSHLDQQIGMQTSVGQGFAATGWGGRLADAMQGCNSSGFPTIVSVGGNVMFATGNLTNPATVTAGQVLGLQGFSTTAASQARLAALQNLLSFDNGVTLVGASNAIGSNGLNQANSLNKALAAPPSALTTVFPNTSLGQQMLQIAKIINVRATLGVNRQIFFAYLGGFDTHEQELNDQSAGLAQVSQALNAFYNATVEMDVNHGVVTFTESDFGRTLQPNGGSSLGTDHAWASHHVIMGDAVKGDVYGTFPTLALQGPDDATSRGVWIPTTSIDQYGATLATWFGVDPAKLGSVFPNLANFSTPPPAFL